MRGCATRLPPIGVSAKLACMMLTREVAALVKGICQGPEDRPLTGVAALDTAGPGDISFFHNPRYAGDLAATQAGAVLVPEDYAPLPGQTCAIRVANPSMAFAEVVACFAPPARPPEPGVHPASHVAEGVRFDPDKVCIAAGACIGRDTIIGDGTVIAPNAVIGDAVTIGADCLIHVNASVREHCRLGDRVIIHANAVIGSDGFGYEMVDGVHRKIEQVGHVVIGNDVEVGAGTTIDRARFGRTEVGEGTKIDNLVQIAHNVVIGRHCILVSQCGIAGSARLGDYVTVAAQAGVAGHVRIGDKVVLMGRAGAIKDITEPGYYMGFPAVPARQAKREIVAVRKLGREG